MNYDITVITPVYNIEEYLPRFFDSILGQSYKSFYLFVVVDGSPDDSLKICNQYAKIDNRIKVFSLDHVGVIKARDFALDMVTTKYTVYADGDDYLEPDYLYHLKSAMEKYDADLAVSRVVYRSVNNEIFDTFVESGERLITKDDFQVWIPRLLDERRLNYLYGKIYKTELLKGYYVAPDVQQGSDTMIVCQYLSKINNLVLLDNLDYNYIKYSTRSITSYSGIDAFERLKRINLTVRKTLFDNGLKSNEMVFVIDKRVLLSAIWVIDKIVASICDENTKINQINNILNDDEYTLSYNRYKQNHYSVNFEVIPPQNGKTYLRKVERQKRSNASKSKK